MSSSYSVISASAGSGKTYTLVQRILMICLRYPDQQDSIRQILALTFTNKAANEMKERILSWLKNFSSEEYRNSRDLANIQRKLEEENIKVSLDELHVRSKKLLDYILHHYSTLNIGTIDKFNSKLVRSFSYELGLAQNFNLEIQAEPLLNEAVDRMLNEIGEDEKISEAFMDFVNYHLDLNERVNLGTTLYESAKEFIQDKHYFKLKENEDFSWEAYENNKTKLRAALLELDRENVELAALILDLLQEKSLEITDFSGGKTNGIAKFFAEVRKYYHAERDTFPFPGNEDSATAIFLKGASSTGKNREAEIFEILDYLLETRRKIIANYLSARKKEKILRALLPLKVHKEIQDKLSEIEEENDLVLLSKFNVLIHENLKNEPSSFIYEKIGTQFYHYFFDEFQDTSDLQWQNFIPLRDHAINSENMSFTVVGDPKQSIYRFRGGDSSMMLNIITQKENSSVKAIPEQLHVNWRSAKNIVDFNNQLYPFLAQFTEEEHYEIFASGSQQIAQSEKNGRVKFHFVENSKKNEFYENVADKMQQDIQECIDQSFNFSDITILCRGNQDIFMYSQLLGNKKVLKNGNEISIKTISEKGLTLQLSNTVQAVIEYLRWENNPKNLQHLVRFLYYLHSSGRIYMQDFSEEILAILDCESREEMELHITEKYGVKLKQHTVPKLNLYNFIEYYILEFSVAGKDTAYLLNFLEMLYNFTQNAGFTLKDFLKYWDEEGRKTSIQASENIDAIQIMTIHKAKGLEFPVVFLPMENQNKDGNFQGWIKTHEENLSSVIISPFDKILENYDEEMQHFNQKNLYSNRIDRFCLQYVATTRASEQMYFYLEKPNKTNNHLEIFEFADDLRNQKWSSLEQKPDTFDLYDNFETSYNSEDKNLIKSETLQVKLLSRAHENTAAIKIATPSKAYQVRNEKVRNGIFVHEILAKINTRNDVEKVLKRYLLDGVITMQEQQEISERILAVVDQHQYQEYFSGKYWVKNEADISFFKNGLKKIYRPDRILENEKGCIIIDFKTGAEEEKSGKEHVKQVEEYKRILENMGKKVIATEIIYF